MIDWDSLATKQLGVPAPMPAASLAEFLGRTTATSTLVTPRAVLEESRIQWRRDWDAIALGFVLGVLTAVVVVLAS